MSWNRMTAYAIAMSRSEALVSRSARLPYLAGLDGLRALAVTGVLLYHGGMSVWGGFLGVETFFVLSGFLITALLLAEWREQRAIDVRRFWLRRARRLLPVLALVLIGTWALIAIRLPEEAAGFRLDLLAALGYVMNWHLIASQQSYFDPLIRPPLLQHLWSLAIEEQFYLFWPLLFGIGMRYLRRWGLLATILAAAVASSVWMASLYQPGADPSRVYYGTDTRASALLIGSALALVWSPWRAAANARRSTGIALDLVGIVALAGLLIAYLKLFEFHPLLYRGGFALVALGSALVILAATHPRALIVPRLLGAWPLRWIGLRSYGIYLWHWPVFMVTRPYIDVQVGGWGLLALQVTVVVALAELSYRFVELPIRRGAIGRAWHALRPRRAPREQAASAGGDAIGIYVQPELGVAPAAPVPVTLPIEAEPRALVNQSHTLRARLGSSRKRHARRR